MPYLCHWAGAEVHRTAVGRLDTGLSGHETSRKVTEWSLGGYADEGLTTGISAVCVFGSLSHI